MKNTVVKGFKVFNSDWTCRDKQYTCPGKFVEEGEIEVCGHGMHFCENAADCFNYYDFDSDNKVAEVIAYGTVLKQRDKSCTNKLEIVREISWDEVLHIVNIGKNCTGRCNTGDGNTGDWNTGRRNTGDGNTGNYNVGNWNTGSCNTGNWNTGDGNTGNGNTGDGNTGNRNAGKYNIGDWNKSSFNTGCFMTEEQKIMLFNKPSDWTYNDWISSDARYLLNQIPKGVVKWVYSENMSNEEKVAYPTHEITGGYLKVLDETECYAQVWWDNLSDTDQNIIKSIPNFDAKIFEECTEIKVDELVDIINPTKHDKSNTEMTAKEIVAKLTPEQKDVVYRELWFTYVRDDVISYTKTIKKELDDETIDNIVEAYVYRGDYDCNLPYWSNIKNLIDKYQR